MGWVLSSLPCCASPAGATAEIRSTVSEPSARDTPRRYRSLPRPVGAQRRCRNLERSSTSKAGTSSNLGLKRSKSPAPFAEQDSFLSPSCLGLAQLLAGSDRSLIPSSGGLGSKHNTPRRSGDENTARVPLQRRKTEGKQHPAGFHSAKASTNGKLCV